MNHIFCEALILPRLSMKLKGIFYLRLWKSEVFILNGFNGSLPSIGWFFFAIKINGEITIIFTFPKPI